MSGTVCAHSLKNGRKTGGQVCAFNTATLGEGGVVGVGEEARDDRGIGTEGGVVDDRRAAK